MINPSINHFNAEEYIQLKYELYFFILFSYTVTLLPRASLPQQFAQLGVLYVNAVLVYPGD